MQTGQNPFVLPSSGFAGQHGHTTVEPERRARAKNSDVTQAVAREVPEDRPVGAHDRTEAVWEDKPSSAVIEVKRDIIRDAGRHQV